jgi:hypothetical protein
MRGAVAGARWPGVDLPCGRVVRSGTGAAATMARGGGGGAMARGGGEVMASSMRVDCLMKCQREKRG